MHDKEVIRGAQIENYATLAAVVIVILGLYAMGAGWFSAVGLVLLLNVNTLITSKDKSDA